MDDDDEENSIVMEGVTEHYEGYSVKLAEAGNTCIGPHQTRLCVVAINEGGYNSTAVDILQLLSWVKTNRPDLLEKVE